MRKVRRKYVAQFDSHARALSAGDRRSCGLRQTSGLVRLLAIDGIARNSCTLTAPLILIFGCDSVHQQRPFK